MSLIDPNIPLEELIPPPAVVNDDHKVYSIAAACIFLGILASLLVLARLSARVWCGSFGPDDYVATAALPLYIGWTAFAGYINLNAGVGKPLWEVTVEEWTLFWKSTLIGLFLYPSMSGSIRISTVLFYQRVFAVGRNMRIAHWVLLAMQIVYIVVFTITPGFICHPMSAINDPFDVLSRCSFIYFSVNQTCVYIISIVFDLILIIIPVIIVLKLQMESKKRQAVCLVFLLGLSATVASVYKFAMHIKEWVNPSQAGPEWYAYLMSRSIPTQFTDYGKTYWIPCQLEPALALIGISLPALRQLYLRIQEPKKGMMQGSSAGSRSRATASNKNISTVASGFYRINDTSDVELHPFAGGAHRY